MALSSSDRSLSILKVVDFSQENEERNDHDLTSPKTKGSDRGF